jgi:hypothetical protein
VNRWAMMAGRGGEVVNDQGQAAQPGGQGNNPQRGAAARNWNAHPNPVAVRPAIDLGPPAPRAGSQPMALQPRRYQADIRHPVQREQRGN